MNALISRTLVGLAATAATASAQDINIGKRGPTPYQVDFRHGISENDRGNRLATESFVPKVWNNHGWAVVNVPYKRLHTPRGDAQGIGDIVIGAGPRFAGKMPGGTYSTLSALGTTLPTGTLSKPALGNGRYDIRASTFGTFESTDKRWHAHTAIEKAWTQNNQGNSPEECTAGIIAGANYHKFNAAAGPVVFRNTSGAATDAARIILRYEHGKDWHVALIGTIDYHNHNTARTRKVDAIMRYNIGKK